MPTPVPVRLTIAAALLALTTVSAGAQETPPESIDEEIQVRETSVAVVPPGSGANLPETAAVSVSVDGQPRRVTRVERILEGKRGDWRFLIYIDPEMAGARTRYLASLALAQRAEDLAALGTVEIVVADAGKPFLERTDSWQRIEAALMERALKARYRLDRGDPARVRPEPQDFERLLERLLSTVSEHEGRDTRALLLLTDGVSSMRGAEALRRAARTLAGAGWVTVPVAWTEKPSEGSAARLSEFESWKQGAEGRDTSAGTRRYVIDLGRVFRRLTGDEQPPAADPMELEPELAALQNLAGETSGMVVPLFFKGVRGKQ